MFSTEPCGVSSTPPPKRSQATFLHDGQMSRRELAPALGDDLRVEVGVPDPHAPQMSMDSAETKVQACGDILVSDRIFGQAKKAEYDASLAGWQGGPNAISKELKRRRRPGPDRRPKSPSSANHAITAND